MRGFFLAGYWIRAKALFRRKNRARAFASLTNRGQLHMVPMLNLSQLHSLARRSRAVAGAPRAVAGAPGARAGPLVWGGGGSPDLVWGGGGSLVMLCSVALGCLVGRLVPGTRKVLGCVLYVSRLSCCAAASRRSLFSGCRPSDNSARPPYPCSVL